MKTKLLAITLLSLLGIAVWAQITGTVPTTPSSGTSVPVDGRNYNLAGFLPKTIILNPSLGVNPALGVSGVTYNARTGTLFVIRNESGLPGHIFEMSTDGAVLRTITNSGFVDTEGICWVSYDLASGSDIFLIVEEDHTTAANESQISLVKLGIVATTLTKGAAGNVTTTTAYSGGTISNLGIEGVAYDAGRGRIYYTAEKRTAAGVPSTPGSTDAKIFTRTVVVTEPFSFGAESQLCDIAHLYTSAALIDIADMCYDRVTDTLLITTQETLKKVIRLNRSTGAILETMTVSAAVGGPEGAAIHPAGTELYIVGEEAEYFRYAAGWHNESTVDTDSTRTATFTQPLVNNPWAPVWKGPTLLLFYGATGEIDLPEAGGYDTRGIIIYNTGAFTITIDPYLTQNIVKDGVAQAGGSTITLSAGAGNYVALVSDGLRWVTLGYKGTLGP